MPTPRPRGDTTPPPRHIRWPSVFRLCGVPYYSSLFLRVGGPWIGSPCIPPQAMDLLSPAPAPPLSPVPHLSSVPVAFAVFVSCGRIPVVSQPLSLSLSLLFISCVPCCLRSRVQVQAWLSGSLCSISRVSCGVEPGSRPLVSPTAFSPAHIVPFSLLLCVLLFAFGVRYSRPFVRREVIGVDRQAAGRYDASMVRCPVCAMPSRACHSRMTLEPHSPSRSRSIHPPARCASPVVSCVAPLCVASFFGS